MSLRRSRARMLFGEPLCALQAGSETVVSETHFANEIDLAGSECSEGLKDGNIAPQILSYTGFKPTRTACMPTGILASTSFGRERRRHGKSELCASRGD